MIREYQGNVFDSDAQIIGHCVNCEGKMGAGIAIQVRRRFPEVFEKYKEFCDDYGEYALKRCLVVPIIPHPKKRFIANLFGQLEAKTYEQAIDYHAFAAALSELSVFMTKNTVKTVAFPKFIGCGLAGGDWKIVLPLIEKCIDNSQRQIQLWQLPED